jgi:DNA (cytosine-5)-methyltransferase 1
MEKLRTLDLFSGIGGFSLGLDSTGYFETVAFCEIEEFPCKVLNKHWPDVPIYNDVRELSYEKLQADGLISRRRGIDVICGGYPCQPFSVAGRQKGEEDPRHLWPEYFRLIRELRPHYVIGENVGGHLRLGLDSVLEDLDSENYTVRCFSVEAASLGAPHRRERIFWIADNVADASSNGRDAKRTDQETRGTLGGSKEGRMLEPEGSGSRSEVFGTEYATDTESGDAQDGLSEQGISSEAESSRETVGSSRRDSHEQEEQRREIAFESYLGGGNDGISAWLDGSWERGIPRVAPSNKMRVPRLKALGNAVLPQLVYMVGMTIVLSTKRSENEEESGG